MEIKLNSVTLVISEDQLERLLDALVKDKLDYLDQRINNREAEIDVLSDKISEMSKGDDDLENRVDTLEDELDALKVALAKVISNA